MPSVHDLTDHKLLIEIMESDAAIQADPSPAAAKRQLTASREGDRRWGPDALEILSLWCVAGKHDPDDLVRFARTDPAFMFRVMNVTPNL